MGHQWVRAVGLARLEPRARFNHLHKVPNRQLWLSAAVSKQSRQVMEQRLALVRKKLMKYQPIKARSKSFMQLGNEFSGVVTSYPEIMEQAGILMKVARA